MVILLLMFFSGRFAFTKSEVDKKQSLVYLGLVGLTLLNLLLAHFKLVMMYIMITFIYMIWTFLLYYHEYLMVNEEDSAIVFSCAAQFSVITYGITVLMFNYSFVMT